MTMKFTTAVAAAALLGAAIAAPAYSATSTPNTSLVEIKDNDVVVTSLAMKVGDLVGKDVYGADGKKVGDIGSVLADAQHNAQAVTVDVGGFLGVGTKNVVVPISKLKPGPEKGTLATAMTKAEIENLSEWKM